MFISIAFSLNVGPNHTALIEGEQAHPAPKGGEATYAPRVHQQPHVQPLYVVTLEEEEEEEERYT